MAPGRFFAARLAACCAGLILTAYPAVAGESAAAQAKWAPWAELGGYASNRSYAERGETTLWAPLMQSAHSMVFTDLRGKLFHDGEQEVNAALGYRFMGANGWNPGIWIGLDRRYSAYGNHFDQLAFGGELLSPDWDIRVNGYVPLEDTKSVSGSVAGTVEVGGGSIFLITGGLEEVALWGVDGEVGWRVPLGAYHPDGWAGDRQGGVPGGRHNDLRLFVGGFYFNHADFAGEVLGPRVRAEWRVENVIEEWEGSRLTFEAAYQYDDVRKERIEAGIRLRIPLGGGTEGGPRLALSPQEKRMTEGLKRDTEVVVRVRSGPRSQEPVEDAATGVDFDSITIVSNGSDLQAAITGAGNNALVVAQGGASNFTGVLMENNQTLLGGGGTILVRGRTTGTVASYTAPGIRPVLSTLLDNGVYGALNSHISGLTLEGQGIGWFGVHVDFPNLVDNMEINNFEYGILIDVPGAVAVVRHTTISGSVANAIHLQGPSALDLRSSTIRDGVNGIYVGPGPSTIAVNDTTFEGGFSARLFQFDVDAHTVGVSTGIVDNAASAGRCILTNGASFGGTLGFTDAGVVSATCN
jgi:hypothetical protein